MDDKPVSDVLGIFTARPWFAPVPHSTQPRGLQWGRHTSREGSPQVIYWDSNYNLRPGWATFAGMVIPK